MVIVSISMYVWQPQCIVDYWGRCVRGFPQKSLLSWLVVVLLERGGVRGEDRHRLWGRAGRLALYLGILGWRELAMELPVELVGGFLDHAATAYNTLHLSPAGGERHWGHFWLPSWPELVAGVVNHVLGSDPLGLVEERLLLRLCQHLPLGAKPARDLWALHLWVGLSNFSPFNPWPHQKCVQRSLDVLLLVICLRAGGGGGWRGGGPFGHHLDHGGHRRQVRARPGVVWHLVDGRHVVHHAARAGQRCHPLLISFAREIGSSLVQSSRRTELFGPIFTQWEMQTSSYVHHSNDIADSSCIAHFCQCCSHPLSNIA